MASARDKAQTLKDRIRHGEALRKQMHRTDQAVFKPKQRDYVPLELLRAQVKGRVPELLPLKWGRMAASPFGYFRGAAAVMAADLAHCGSTGYGVQIYGDAHLRNLGAYAVHDDRLVFDANDFDETCHGPWEWDIKRMATSLVLAAREAGHADDAAREGVLRFAGVYRKRMAELGTMPVIEVARTFVHRHLSAAPIAAALRKAEHATPMANLEKLTRASSGGTRVFRENKPLLWRVKPQKQREVLAALRGYRETLSEDARSIFGRYRAADVCFKVVGTGSVGVRDYVVLLFGNGEHDPLFLQMKEAPASVYAPYLREDRPAQNEGRRVVSGQRLLQAECDLLLGWTSMQGRDYLVRQLADHKGTAETTDLAGSALDEYAQMCGEVLARGHARAGDAAVIHGYIGSGAKFDRAVASFAADYAAQTLKDHAQLVAAADGGRLRAEKVV